MADWADELSVWLAPFLVKLGHKARRRMCPLYVAGLIGPGDRKSVGPMAEPMAPGDYDQLHHFVSDGVWDEGPLEMLARPFGSGSRHGAPRVDPSRRETFLSGSPFFI